MRYVSEAEYLRAAVMEWVEQLREDDDFITRGPTEVEENLLAAVGKYPVKVPPDGDWVIRDRRG